MAPDDRDRKFDQALSRHLRSAADLAPGAGLQSSSCLDPETLAAYYERSLLPEEMNSAKEHIVGCAHCQAILAQLELTESIPVGAVEEEKVLAMAPALPARAESGQPAVPAALPPKARAPRTIRGPRWQWLVPAGALAAGLLVWISFHENPKPSALPHEEIKMAKAQEPPAPLPSLEKQAAAAPSTAQFDELSRVRGAGGGAASGAISRDAEALKQLQKSLPAAKVARAMPPPRKELDLRKDSVADSSAALIQTEKQEDLDAKAGIAGERQAQENLQVQNQAVNNQAVNIQAQNQMTSQKVAGPAPLSQAETAKKAKSDSGAMYRAAAPPPAAPSAVSAFSDTTSMEVAAMSNRRLIAAQDTRALWLAGRSGLLEFSSDGGRHWSRQTSGVLVDLLSGSAPTDKVCWIVGRVGTILLTTDGGAHWSILHSPLDEDLGGVRAVDALHATIWNLRNTKSFETADGGVIWKPVPGP